MASVIWFEVYVVDMEGPKYRVNAAMVEKVVYREGEPHQSVDQHVYPW